MIFLLRKSQVKEHLRQEASGKTTVVHAHTDKRQVKGKPLPTSENIDKQYEGPFVASYFGGPKKIQYRVHTANRKYPDKAPFGWNLDKHPEDEYSDKVKEYEQMKADLNRGTITHRRVQGRGATKKTAMAWIEDTIQGAKADLAEVTAKKIPRHSGELPKENPAEKPKKEPQQRVSKEGADHLFGKDKPKPTASERGLMRHKELSSVNPRYVKSVAHTQIRRTRSEAVQSREKKGGKILEKSMVMAVRLPSGATVFRKA